ERCVERNGPNRRPSREKTAGVNPGRDRNLARDGRPRVSCRQGTRRVIRSAFTRAISTSTDCSWRGGATGAANNPGAAAANCNGGTPMKFDLLYEVEAPYPWPEGQRKKEQESYKEAMEQIILCDRMGFNICWLV